MADYVDCIDCDDNFDVSYVQSESERSDNEAEEYYDGAFYETESQIDENHERRRRKEGRISRWEMA